METTLVILAGGLGSRFGGNKQISHVGPNGEILMEYSIFDAIAAGFTQIVLILKEEMVETVRASLDPKLAGRARVDYVVQDMTKLPVWYTVPADRVKPFGTVHAVLCAKEIIGGPFATVNADDYYGKEAFRIMKKHLDAMRSAKDACMVPYVLGNTMSENGGVTRGVCRLCRGKLSRITETHEIHYDEDRRIVGEFGALTGEEAVSMNIWGLHPELLPQMQRYFDDFLRALDAEELKAECLLPVMIGDFLKEKSISVKAEVSADRWFGITYQADRESVMQELVALHASGAYPKTLF